MLGLLEPSWQCVDALFGILSFFRTLLLGGEVNDEGGSPQLSRGWDSLFGSRQIRKGEMGL